MDKRAQKKELIREEINQPSFPLIEASIEMRLDQVVTVLDCGGNDESGVYDQVLSIVEKALIKIALRRCNNVQTAAADFLGINRNTLHSKIMKLKIRVENSGG